MTQSKPRILVVEDSPEFQLLIQATLGPFADVRVVGQLREAERLLREDQYDLVVLDLMLPDGFGYDLMKKQLPFPSHYVVLSARNDSGDKVFGFQNGILDYIVKPFDVFEFQARIQSQLHRLKQAHAAPSPTHHGNFQLDPTRSNITSPTGGTTHLTAKEFAILTLLAKRSGVVARETLLDQVWGQDVHVQPRAVDAMISRLRRKLAEHMLDLRNEYGAGYELVPITAAPTPQWTQFDQIAQQLGGDREVVLQYCELLLQRCQDLLHGPALMEAPASALGKIAHELAGSASYLDGSYAESLEKLRHAIEQNPSIEKHREDLLNWVRRIEHEVKLLAAQGKPGKASAA